MELNNFSIRLTDGDMNWVGPYNKVVWLDYFCMQDVDSIVRVCGVVAVVVVVVVSHINL